MSKRTPVVVDLDRTRERLEKLGLGHQHTAVLGAFLTVLSDYRSVPTPD